MMNFRTITLLGIACAGRLFAQPSTSDCDGAIQLCGGIYTETAAPPGTGNLYEFTGVCNANLETSSLWYTFTVQTAGDLSFILDPATDTDDYDWGLFNITHRRLCGHQCTGWYFARGELQLLWFAHRPERTHRHLHGQWWFGYYERPW